MTNPDYQSLDDNVTVRVPQSPSKILDCGNCSRLVVNVRTDFFPPGKDYYCESTADENWLGFFPLRRKGCHPLLTAIEPQPTQTDFLAEV